MRCREVRSKQRVVMMPTLSTLAPPQVVVTTTCGGTSHDTGCIMTAFGFKCWNLFSQMKYPSADSFQEYDLENVTVNMSNTLVRGGIADRLSTGRSSTGTVRSILGSVQSRAWHLKRPCTWSLFCEKYHAPNQESSISNVGISFDLTISLTTSDHLRV